MASYYRPEKTYLKNRNFTYSNDTPILIINAFSRRWCRIYFLRRRTCLLNRFKHEVCVRKCEEGQRNDNSEEASEKKDKPMSVMAAQVVNPVNIQRTELAHLMETPEIMV
jgi:hypothetical protein